MIFAASIVSYATRDAQMKHQIVLQPWAKLDPGDLPSAHG
jgi:hypothetical protein